MADSPRIAAGRSFLMNETTIGRRAATWLPISIVAWLDASYEGGWGQFVIDGSRRIGDNMTRFVFSTNGPIALATIHGATSGIDDDGTTWESNSVSYVYCAIPGGRPRFTFDLSSRDNCAVADAPAIDNMSEFKSFVRTRWSD